MATPELPADEASDQALVALALDGDRAAFGRLVLRRQGVVRARLRRLTGGDLAWADDLAQETFLTAWMKLGQFRREARFGTWLFKIAYTTFLQSARRRRIEVEYGDCEDIEGVDDSIRQALSLDLGRAFRSLKDTERMAIVLFYQMDLSLAEVAYVQGLPQETVKTQIARGKARLRKSLSAWRPGQRMERADDEQ
jgi:RNA polymerase sigma-70 factor (ECF subfamily)